MIVAFAHFEILPDRTIAGNMRAKALNHFSCDVAFADVVLLGVPCNKFEIRLFRRQRLAGHGVPSFHWNGFPLIVRGLLENVEFLLLIS